MPTPAPAPRWRPAHRDPGRELAAAQDRWERQQTTATAWKVADTTATSAEGTQLTRRPAGAWLAAQPTATDSWTLGFAAPRRRMRCGSRPAASRGRDYRHPDVEGQVVKKLLA